jgi:hypothetical protein
MVLASGHKSIYKGGFAASLLLSPPSVLLPQIVTKLKLPKVLLKMLSRPLGARAVK